MKHEPQTDFRTPPPAAPATKKPKLARDPNDIKRKATPKASSATSPTTSRGTLSIADKRAIMEKGMEVLAKQLPFKELSEQLGVAETRLRDQFKPNRANLRGVVEELFK